MNSTTRNPHGAVAIPSEVAECRPREAWARRTDANGEVLCRVQLVALGDEDAEIIRVVIPGDPEVSQGEMVGRPSTLYLDVIRGAIHVGGRVIELGRGTLTL